MLFFFQFQHFQYFAYQTTSTISSTKSSDSSTTQHITYPKNKWKPKSLKVNYYCYNTPYRLPNFSLLSELDNQIKWATLNRNDLYVKSFSPWYDTESGKGQLTLYYTEGSEQFVESVGIRPRQRLRCCGRIGDIEEEFHVEVDSIDPVTKEIYVKRGYTKEELSKFLEKIDKSSKNVQFELSQAFIRDMKRYKNANLKIQLVHEECQRKLEIETLRFIRDIQDNIQKLAGLKVMQKVFDLNTTLTEERLRCQAYRDKRSLEQSRMTFQGLVQQLEKIENECIPKNWFTNTTKIIMPVLERVLDQFFNKDSTLEILDGPPKSKDPFMLEIILQAITLKKWRVIAMNQVIDPWIEKIVSEIEMSSLETPIKILAVKKPSFVFISVARSSARTIYSGKIKKVKHEEFHQMLLEADLTIIEPIQLSCDPFLDFVTSGKGWDLSITAKPHEYTEPVLTLALATSKRCLLSLNSISCPLPKIRNPYDREYRYRGVENVKKCDKNDIKLLKNSHFCGFLAKKTFYSFQAFIPIFSPIRVKNLRP